MVQILCMFFPAFITIKCVQILKNEEFSIKQLITTYGFYVLLINIIAHFFVIYVIDGLEPLKVDEMVLGDSFAFSYMLLSVAIGLVLSFIHGVICKKITFEFN